MIDLYFILEVYIFYHHVSHTVMPAKFSFSLTFLRNIKISHMPAKSNFLVVFTFS